MVLSLFVTVNFRQVKNNFPIVWFQDAHYLAIIIIYLTPRSLANKQVGLNKRVGLVIFDLSHEKQQVGWTIS